MGVKLLKVSVIYVMMNNYIFYIRNSLNEVPKNIPSNEIYILFEQRISVNRKIISIPLWIENHSYLKDKFLDLIYDLTYYQIDKNYLVENFNINKNNYWWSSNLFETDNETKSDQINSILKIIAFQDIISKYEGVEIFLCEELENNINSVILDYLINKKINYKLFKSRKITGKNFFLKLIDSKYKYLLKGIFSLIKLYLRNYKYRNLTDTKEIFNSKKHIYFNYFSVNQIKKEKDFSSQYWGELPKISKDKFQITWLNLLAADPNNEAKIIKNFLNKSNSSNIENHFFIESLINLRLMLQVFKIWIKVVITFLKLQKRLSLIRLNDIQIWQLLEKDFKESFIGGQCIMNIFYNKLFEICFKKLKKENVLFLLNEGQGFEYSLISQWKKKSNNKIFSVRHATTRYWDLRYQVSKKFFNKNSFSCRLPTPSFYVSNGIYSNKLLKSFIPENLLLNAEALRYNNPKLKKTNYKNKRKYKVVIFTTNNNYVSEKILSFASKFIDKGNKDISFYFKPHPDQKIINRKWPNINFLEPTVFIHDVLVNTDLAITSPTTSAALDAYISGVSVLTFLSESRPNFSPLYNCKGVLFFSSYHVFEEKILYLLLSNMKNEQKINSYFTINKNLYNWKRIFSEYIN